MLKKNQNSPNHLFIDNTPYFITGAVYQKRPLLVSDDIKQSLLEIITNCFIEKSWQLHHWVILDNHYHLLCLSQKGSELPKIMRKIHGLSAHNIKEKTHCNLPVWWNYWDYCPRDEKDYLIRLNYLFNNPIKHGYVENLANYPFSSFHQFYKKQGREALVQQFKDNREYKHLSLKEDDF